MGNKAKQLPLLLAALAALCLLAALVAVYESQPNDSASRPTLAVFAGMAALAFLLLTGFWTAKRPSRPAHVVSVGLRIAYGLTLFFMALQVWRDFEIRVVTRDTWICAAILAVGIPALWAPKIIAALRRNAACRRADHVVMGTIFQIMGETSLDLDGDPVTKCHALIEFEADGRMYETRADISRRTIRRFGRPAFIGKKVPVFYDPADPAGAFVSKIDKHLFDMV